MNSEASDKNVAGKIFSLFWEPSETFRALKAGVDWTDIAIPLILVIIISLISISYITPIALQEQRTRIENSERLSDQQKEQVLDRMESRSDSVMPYITTPIVLVIKLAIVAAVILFLNNFIMGGEAKFLTFLGVAAYVGLIDGINILIKLPLIVSQQTTRIHTSLALLFEQSETFFFRLMANLDLFSLWKVALFAIALAVFNQKKTARTFSIVFLFWIGYCLLAAAFGGLFKI